MDACRYIVLVLILTFVSKSVSRPIIQLFPNHQHCESWKYNVETNNAGEWSIPERCQKYVQAYMTSHRYWSDLEMLADYAVEYLNTVNLTTKDAWIFDIDDTLISSVPLFIYNGFGSKISAEGSYNEWVDPTNLPAIPAGKRLYNAVEAKGLTIILLTGRDESQRYVTEQNLIKAGYTHWDRLILRQTSDLGKPAIIYKSEKRKELEHEGYTIHGSAGDQWSDLLGFPTAKRSFKLPNLMYYAP